MRLFITACILCTLITFHCTASDSSSVRLEIRPQKVAFSPFQGSLNEPRFGLIKSLSTSTIKVDIGNSVDLARLFIRDSVNTERGYSLGIDFFTYAHVTGWEGFGLQVDAVDGLFGGHITHSIPLDRNELQLRFRFLHLSSHYVDGHFDVAAGQWKEGREPIPFTRDMADFSIAYKFGDARLYLILEHAFRIRPFNQRRTWYQAGSEWFFGHFHDLNLHTYFSQDFRLVGFKEYSINSTSIIGMKLGEMYGSGINVFLRYYSGEGPSSEYSDIKSAALSLGFSVDYW